MNQRSTNQLLGYPDDARLLIINADDLGMCHAINAAIFEAIKDGLVASTSLMVPCPWGLHAMKVLAQNPDIAFGVHLTLVCDAEVYRWGPVTAKADVPSLVDETGYFFNNEGIPEMLAQAKLDEVEREFRAQIETVVAAKLKPTHLDWHCLGNGGRDDIFEMTRTLAKEYGFALRADGEPSARLQSLGLPANNHDIVDSYRLDTANKTALYTRMLRELPAGLSEWAVHPGFDNAEYLTIHPHGPRVRQTDYDAMMSAEVRETIEQEGIILLDYKPLQAMWQAMT